MVQLLFRERGTIDVPACHEPPLLPPVHQLGEHYRKHLLGTERSAPAFRATLHELLLDACDEPVMDKRAVTPGIFETLGGAQTAVIDVGQFWLLVAMVPRDLRLAAYVRSEKGAILTVCASWMHGPGWGRGQLWVESGPYNRPYRWGAGCTFVTK